MSRSAFKRFEFFDVDTLSNDVTGTLVRIIDFCH